MKLYRIEAEAGQGPAIQAGYREFLRVHAMSAGLYQLDTGTLDRQSPHGEDEIYYVLAGAAKFSAGSDTRGISAGDLIYVPAGEQHRFHDIRVALKLLVVFAPPENSVTRSPDDSPALLQ